MGSGRQVVCPECNFFNVRNVRPAIFEVISSSRYSLDVVSALEGERGKWV